MNRRWMAGGLAALALTLGTPALVTPALAATTGGATAAAQQQADPATGPTQSSPGPAKRPDARHTGKHRMLVRVLSELSGKSPQEVADLLRSGKSREEVLKQLGVTEDQVKQRLQELRQQWQQQHPWAHRRALVRVLSELSGKSPQEVADLLRSGKSKEEVLKQLGVTEEQVKQRLQQLRQQWKERHQEKGKGAVSQSLRQGLVQVLSRLTGKSPAEIAALWTKGKGLKDVLAELKVDPQDLRKELRTFWQQHKGQHQSRGATPADVVPTGAANE